MWVSAEVDQNISTPLWTGELGLHPHVNLGFLISDRSWSRDGFGRGMKGTGFGDDFGKGLQCDVAMACRKKAEHHDAGGQKKLNHIRCHLCDMMNDEA